MARGRRPRLLAALVALATGAVAGGMGCTADGEVSEPVVTPPSGWTVTVYYTAVERYHPGPPKRVTGCLALECEHRNAHIGYYPSDFVDAVEFGGSGWLDTGRYAGQYLNWAEDVGFWVDDFPRTGGGSVLVPFASAAADPDELAPGTVFVLADCGTLADGGAVPTAVCEQLRSAFWRVADDLTSDIAGERHIDLYVGDETRETFANGSAATSFVGVGLRTGISALPANPFDPSTPGFPGTPGGPPDPADTGIAVAPGSPTTTAPTTPTTAATVTPGRG